MSAPTQKVILKPGDSIVLQVSGAVKVQASPCPDDDDDNSDWSFPGGGLTGLEVGEKLIGAIASVEMRAATGSLRQITDPGVRIGERIAVQHVVPIVDVGRSLAPPMPSTPLRVIVPHEEIDLDAFEPLLIEAGKHDRQVEFRIAEPPGG